MKITLKYVKLCIQLTNCKIVYADTVSPTASLTASMPFTSAKNVSVNITFTEPCVGGGGFGCSSVNACDLLVYGAGHVIPSIFTVLDQYLRYSLLVGLSPDAQYGRIVLVINKSVTAGNNFKRALGSRFFVHFDRRNVFVNLPTHVPEKLIKLNNQTRTVQATNDNDKLNVYLYFSEPVLNSSAEILILLSTNQGDLLPIDGKTNGNRRFAYMDGNVIAKTHVDMERRFCISPEKWWTTIIHDMMVAALVITTLVSGVLASFFLKAREKDFAHEKTSLEAHDTNDELRVLSCVYGVRHPRVSERVVGRGYKMQGVNKWRPELKDLQQEDLHRSSTP